MEHSYFSPQVKFEMSDETTLADLLQLNLHNYEDEVRNIVDKAVKESGMEKVPFVGIEMPFVWDDAGPAGPGQRLQVSHFPWGPAVTSHKRKGSWAFSYLTHTEIL